MTGGRRSAALLRGSAVPAIAGAVTFALPAVGDLAPALQRGLIRGTAVLLLLFLFVLVLRYLVLLWLGYLHHLDGIREEGAPSGGSGPAGRPDGGGPDARAAGSAPPVSVVVPAYDESPGIEAALRSLLELDYPRYEIVVVDDGSTDDTFRRAARFRGRHGGATVRVLRQANAGKAAALNLGIARSRHPYVLCMDGDSRLVPGALRAAMRRFRDPGVAAVAGNVKVVNRGTLWSRLQALEYVEGLNMARRAQAFLRAVNIIPGPIGVFRREALEHVGGYDSDTFAEDADLTLKLLSAGWSVEYEDRAIALTEAPERATELIKQRYRWTRGILQALGKRWRLLIRPPDAVTWGSVAMMLFEAVLWPVMNVAGHLFFAVAALAFGAGTHLLAWWLLLTGLDVAAALHTVAMEEEDVGLVPLAFVYRFFFILFVDVSKLFAGLEELAGLEMSWGRVERLGRI